jgi:hypothetical protein
MTSDVAQKYPSGMPPGALDEKQQHLWSDRTTTIPRPGILVVAEESSERSKSDRPIKRAIIQKLGPDMIRRMDYAPMPVNPSGWVTEGKPPSLRSTCSRTSEVKDQTVDVVGSDCHFHGSPEVKPNKESFKSFIEPSVSSNSEV